MRKIIMVDLWTKCDKEGKPIGHGLKVANEYYDYIKKDFIVIQYVNSALIKYLDNPRKKAFRIDTLETTNKIKRFKLLFQKIKEVYAVNKKDVIWFYIPDWYTYLLVALLPKGERRIAINVFEEFAYSMLKHIVFKKAINKADIIFVSNSNIKDKIKSSILISDYTYNEAYYRRYCSTKKEQAVCLGTMNEKKQLFELVKCFSKNKYPLHIVGQFKSVELFRKLSEIKSENIIVEDRYLSPEDYYKLLGESKYCILPYDKNFYYNRTSGVLQECIFVDTIPISAKSILTSNSFSGVGYNQLEELEDIDLYSHDCEKYIVHNRKIRAELYDYNNVREKILKGFNKYGFKKNIS